MTYCLLTSHAHETIPTSAHCYRVPVLGVCINHWYHVKTTLDPHREKGTKAHDNSENEFQNTPSGGHFAQAWGTHGWSTDPKHQTDPKANVAPEAKHF